MRIISYHASRFLHAEYIQNIERNVKGRIQSSFGLRYSLVASIRKVWWSFASAITHKWELSPPWLFSLSLSLFPSSFLARGSNGEGGKGLNWQFNPFAATPLRISARVWDRCRVYSDNGRQGRTMDRKLLYIPVLNTSGGFLLSRGIVSTITCLNYCTLAMETNKFPLFHQRMFLLFEN